MGVLGYVDCVLSCVLVMCVFLPQGGAGAQDTENV